MVLQNSTLQNQLKMLPSALVDMVYDYTPDTGPKELVLGQLLQAPYIGAKKLILGQLGQMAPILAIPGPEVRNRARRIELTKRMNIRLAKGYHAKEYF